MISNLYILTEKIIRKEKIILHKISNYEKVSYGWHKSGGQAGPVSSGRG